LTPVSRELIWRTLVGSAYLGIDTERDPEEAEYRNAACRTLVRHAKYELSDFRRRQVMDLMSGKGFGGRDTSELRTMFADAIRTDLMEHSGTWRFVVSLLALMNAQDYVQSNHVPVSGNRSRLASGKIIPYLDCHTVTLKLPRKIVEAHIIRQMADAVPKRRHDVIGHWKHSRKRFPPAPGCGHAFVNATATMEACALCGHRRWWVNEFERGDASVGFVLKDRVVKT